jgi:hypothetical protein
MAHSEQREFFESVKARFPEYFRDVRVLDVGSLDVNGNLRGLFDMPCWYTGIDIGPGKNVDVVCPGHLFDAGCLYNTVISAECLEHDMFWKRTIMNMYNLTWSGGLIALSCATTGRKEHGTMRSEPMSSPLTTRMRTEWSDYYRNLTEEDFRSVWDPDEMFSEYEFQTNDKTHDLYFWGISL